MNNNNDNNPNSPPDTGEEWLSLSPGVEFQPSSFEDEDEETAKIMKHHLNRLLSSSHMNAKNTNTNEYELQFIDGTETYYNDYAQAWRLLGFYIDCMSPKNNYNQCSNQGGGQNQNNNNNNNSYQAPCQRYLLWAAYIDLQYSGGGIGEYSFYDRSTNSWDSSSCIASNGRCAKMDCHLKSTNFKLLGFFKEPNYHEWMEQLFKHQGVCLWTDSEYYFMETDRYLWPCDCTNTYQTDENGNYLYYDTKPMSEGRIGLGLYTDSRCSQDYQGEMNVEDVLQSFVNSENYNKNNNNHNNNYGTVSDLATSLSSWNDAFDVFKVCQPCKAYDLGYNADLTNSGGNRQGGDESEEGGKAFACFDDANYVSVNQCMKFRTKTEMLTADFRDIMLADQQGTIVQVEVMGHTYGQGGYGRSGMSGGTETRFSVSGSIENGAGPELFAFFGISVLVFLIGGIMAIRARRNAKKESSLQKPLVSSSAADDEELSPNKDGVMS